MEEVGAGYALASACRWAAWASAYAAAEADRPGQAARCLQELKGPKEVSASLEASVAAAEGAAGEAWPKWRPAVEVAVEIAAGTVKAGAADAKLEKPLERMAAQLGLFWMYSARSEHSEAWRCMCAALQHFRAAWWLRPPWRGANLGGWFLLEPGPASPFFEICHAALGGKAAAPREAPPNLADEHSLCRALAAEGEELKRELFLQHRSSHYTAETMQRITACGLNAVRLPLGHWVLQESGEAYEGPCLEQLDAAVDLVESHNLQLLLDLHGGPGGESGDRPCGRVDPTWSWEKWRVDEAVRLLAFLAGRYAGRPCVTGVQVCNEPSESIPVKRLCDFYEDAIEAIRASGMSADQVAVVLPIFTHWRMNEITECWKERGNFLKFDNVAFDLHYYHNFSSVWNLLSQQQHLEVVGHHALELKALPGAVVGEWSLSRPGDFAPEEQTEFAEQQVLAYNHASHGWFFWNWHDHDFYMDWDMERGVFGSGKLPKPLSKAHLQGFLHPDWEQEGWCSIPSRVPGLWPRLLGWAQFLRDAVCG